MVKNRGMSVEGCVNPHGVLRTKILEHQSTRQPMVSSTLSKSFLSGNKIPKYVSYNFSTVYAQSTQAQQRFTRREMV